MNDNEPSQCPQAAETAGIHGAAWATGPGQLRGELGPKMDFEDGWSRSSELHICSCAHLQPS